MCPCETRECLCRPKYGRVWRAGVPHPWRVCTVTGTSTSLVAQAVALGQGGPLDASISIMKNAFPRSSLFMTACLLTACAVDDSTPGPAPPVLPSGSLVENPTIQSLVDFDRAVRAGANPFDVLAPDELTRIRDSLVFEDGRVSEVDYELARASLPTDRYLDLMYLFGFDLSDHPVFAGIPAPHPSAPRPGRDYCALHGPPRLGADGPPPAIATRADAERLLLRGPSPLDALSADAREEFVRGLEFTDEGVATLIYDRAEAELSPGAFAELLGLLGLDEDGILREYRCESRGTCDFAHRKACAPKHCSDKPR